MDAAAPSGQREADGAGADGAQQVRPLTHAMIRAWVLAEDLREKRRRSEAVAADAVRRAEAAEARLRAIEASTVWRMTAGLRAFVTRHPGVRRGLRVAGWTLTGTLPRHARWWLAARRARAAAAPVPATLRLPTSDAPRVSVIVPTFGQADWTLRCLAAMAAHPPRAAFEVIVADDASGDPAVDRLADVAGLRLVRQTRNRGFLLNCNEAAQAGRGDFLLLLNNDTEVRAGWLDELLAVIEGDPRAGAVGAKLLFPDGTLQEAGGIIWNDASGWNYGRGDDPGHCEYNYVREADWCSGAALLVRRDAWEAMGGFDPAYAPAYCEDSDLAFRLRAAGWRVLYAPRAEVVHHEGVSHGTDLGAGVKAYQVRNQALLRARWGAVLEEAHYPNGTHVLRARDRARGRRVTLVVDHMVPEPDRDAGSRTMRAFIDALRDAGDVVKFWPQNRYRTPGYAALLEACGVEVLYGTRPFADWLDEYGGEIDRVLMSRPSVAAATLAEVRAYTDARVLFYGHDLHQARLRARAALSGDPADHAAADAAEAEERLAWSLADVVAYPSEEEAAAVRRMVPGVDARALVPYAFDDFPHVEAPRAGASILMVAGFAHPPNGDAAAWFAAEVLPLVRASVPEAVLTLAGSKPSEAVRALAGEGVRVVADLPEDALAALYASARVAVVPLRYGAGVKMKMVEALRAGLPAVATPTGVQGLPGLDGIVPVADAPEDFAREVVTLLRDDAAWRRQAAAQAAYAARHFSRAALAESLRAAFG